MWPIQYFVRSAEFAVFEMKSITWVPTQTAINFVFALLCLLAALGVCPRRVMVLNALLYLILCIV